MTMKRCPKCERMKALKHFHKKTGLVGWCKPCKAKPLAGDVPVDGEIELGRYRRTPVGAVADKAARAIAVSGVAWALTMDPEGRWKLEQPEDAAEVDIVGTYSGAGLFTLAMAITSDLKHEIELRAGA